MGNIRIVTDSTADIPADAREKYGITMVPLKVLFGEETFRDAIDMTTDDFYARLKTSTVMPTTSQPSPAEFSDVYERLLAEDPTGPIISIHLASVLSGTYQSATIAQSMIEAEDANITVIDSKSASYGNGMQVILAAKMAEAGASVEEIVAAIEERQKNAEIYFLVDTLEYLQKGGRIGRAAALIGSLLNIKPILSLDEVGAVYSADKARGSKKAMAKIVELLKEAYGDAEVGLVVAKTDDATIAQELEARVTAELNVKEIHYTAVGTVVGTHTGPGTSAVFLYKV
ncbi:DegV family protein [Paenibacillus endoradicis]|uniref:DegV family protein n=1 Tax=Paenibacillus endoradicis TaxID=2972487 RepID=UPI002158F748|nr:DegV family protein [Paenibacillus endoradicis]MCR8656128.1 DegV family protein [Paenibacillus endoradicis]MCR8658454.1 DegV family protein [Paenibacillus endoradicis]